MKNTDLMNKIIDKKIIAIIRGVSPEKMIPLVEALYLGGIELVEVTFNHESKVTIEETLNSLTLIHKEFGKKIGLGVGTVLSTDQVEQAVNAGAEYIISPNTDIDVIRKTKELGKISIPGAFTPTEIVAAYSAGADFVKLFPAGILGVQYIKAILAPLKHIPVIAVGGIDEKNIRDFLATGVYGVGVGGNLVDVKAINEENFNKITQTAKNYLEKI